MKCIACIMSDAKAYCVNGNIYTFDIDEAYTSKSWCGTIWFGKCRENGKTAWLDSQGIQFEGERRFEATEIKKSEIRLNPYQYIWGGKVRDKRHNSMCARPFFPK